MRQNLLRRIRLVLVLALAPVALALATTGIAFGETPSAATNITLSVAKSASPGQGVHLSSRLVDSAGAAVAGAKIAFVVPDVFFLGATSDVSIAEVTTDKDGVAEAEYQVRDTGWLEVRAEFRGNDRVAAAKATSRLLIEAVPHQLYVEHVGIQVPGLNAPPSLQPRSTEFDLNAGASLPPVGLASLWPALSVWPIALVLIIIWSLYATAVRQMFRIAAEGGDAIVADRNSSGGRPWIIAGGAEGMLDEFAVLPSKEEGK